VRGVTDTMNAWKHIPVLRVDDLKDTLPFNCIPVAVELTTKAKPLTTFKHPERAFYVFGPEDGDVPKNVLSWCQHEVFIPTKGCVNLAQAVNVVLYDRLLKAADKH